MKKTSIAPLVFFNSSVILAGLASPAGGSAKLLNLVNEEKLRGIISEVILDEVTRRANKINFTSDQAGEATLKIFKYILSPPKLSSVNKFSKIVSDPGDQHVLASASEANVNYLVSLDKKHILVLESKIKKFIICSPKELIEIIS